MNELSGGNHGKPLSDADVIRLGFCPECHGPDSRVRRTITITVPETKVVRGRPRTVKVEVKIRYRQCIDCGRNFRTKEMPG